MSYEPKTPEEKAAAKGLIVVRPEPNELFLDIDSEADFEKFESLILIFKEHRDELCSWTKRPSPSGKPGRYHVVVTLSAPVKDQMERIVLQALLGSDTKRELIAYVDDRETCLFEKPAEAV